ncbi:hypothetical protein [Halobacillus litoralis]|uniref:Rad50/SbcC-type AAA domain-containing protein n=1 Tax=Halobacillus litoralis TaxID=45668 RepID=A0A410MCC0_9BACI|nr:hypothetical protein [Halobacillus litoralis]QAS52323.1 hypothetical protein HLI_08825 [Halobacillus litoralis]
MKIHKVAIGNSTEAFIESSFSDTLNIISSDDNNRGKTILVQSMMYCFGNVPTFPSTFNYQDYYHIVGFSVGNKSYSLCRKKNSFILKDNTSLMVFDSVSELKRYWTKNIFKLPIILKDGQQKIVDPELFLQLFFVGQDKKETDNISNRGYYKKDDFYNMLYSFANLGSASMPIENIDLAKAKIHDLRDERTALLKQHKILKSNKKAPSYLSSVNDKISFKRKIKLVERKKNQIADLRKSRNAALSRKSKYEITLKELNSLNRTISGGEIRCMDCKSSHIGFSSSTKSSYTFDVSTPEIRRQIIESINEKISSAQEDIDRYTININNSQEEMESLLLSEEISLELLISYNQDVYNASEVENRIEKLDEEIQKISDSIEVKKSNSEKLVEQQHQLMKKIIDCMNDTYRKINPLGNLVFESLYTKRNQNFSGSEATEFHLIKLYSLVKVLKFNFPVVIDSFRAEDLSTEKEDKVLKLFNELGTQIIFTTTLKKEEIGKYENQSFINHIDYSSHMPSKMLSTNYLSGFHNIITDFGVRIGGE